MSQSSDRRELGRQLEQAKRLVSEITDQTTYQRLKAFVGELSDRLQQHVAARRSKEAIRARAHELWEQHGRPPRPQRGPQASAMERRCLRFARVNTAGRVQGVTTTRSGWRRSARCSMASQPSCGASSTSRQ